MSSPPSVEHADSRVSDLTSEQRDSMQDSEISMPSAAETPSGSVSEEESGSGGGGGGGWFSISDITSLARSIKRSIPPAIDGIADAIHRSALTVAAEFAQMERDAEREASRWREENYGDSVGDADVSGVVVLPLPWEVAPSATQEQHSAVPNSTTPSYTEDVSLKQKILALSLDEKMFLQPYGVTSAEVDSSGNFLDEARIHLIRRLLNIDQKLASMHSKISGRSDVRETIFWKNYFYHCEKLREETEGEAEGETETASPDAEADRRVVQSPPPSFGSGMSFEFVNPSADDRSKYAGLRDVNSFSPTSPPNSISLGDLVIVGEGGEDIDDLGDEGIEESDVVARDRKP